MNKETLAKIGAEWKALNDEYDTMIVECIDTPDLVTLTPETLSELKAMQDRLFGIEVEILAMIQEQ